MSAPRWLVGVVAVAAAVPVLVGGSWATYLVADRANRTIGGKAGENVAAAIGVVGLCLIIVAATAVAIWPNRLPWFGGARRAGGGDGQRRFAKDLARLRNDPILSRWWPLAKRLNTAYPLLVEKWERRYQQLLADPKRRHWAERALAGEQPDDAEIDYRDDPTLHVTCIHLQPLESDLRRDDPSTKPVFGLAHAVRCDVELDASALARLGHPAGVEFCPAYDNARESEPAAVHCRACRSSIFGGWRKSGA